MFVFQYPGTSSVPTSSANIRRILGFFLTGSTSVMGGGEGAGDGIVFLLTFFTFVFAARDGAMQSSCRIRIVNSVRRRMFMCDIV